MSPIRTLHFRHVTALDAFFTPWCMAPLPISMPNQCLKVDWTYLCPIRSSQPQWISWRRSSCTSRPMKWSTFAGWCAMCGKTWQTASPCGGRDAEERDFGSPLCLKRPQTGGCFTSCALTEGISSRTRERKVRSTNSCSTHT